MHKNDPQGPRCATCKRPLTPWLEAPMRSSQKPPGGLPSSKFVCYAALCNKYGLVIRVEPSSGMGGRREAD